MRIIRIIGGLQLLFLLLVSIILSLFVISISRLAIVII